MDAKSLVIFLEAIPPSECPAHIMNSVADEAVPAARRD